MTAGILEKIESRGGFFDKCKKYAQNRCATTYEATEDWYEARGWYKMKADFEVVSNDGIGSEDVMQWFDTIQERSKV